MANRRRLQERFAFAARAVHHHRLRRRPVLEVLEGRACWPRSPSQLG